jgi:hypothetical protein
MAASDNGEPAGIEILVFVSALRTITSLPTPVDGVVE